MNHATKCKFCAKPLVLWIDPLYAEMGDPMKLLKLAACNICADLRVRHRKIEDTIAHCCNALNQGVKKGAGSEFKEVLTDATRKYATVTAQIHNLNRAEWNQAFADLLFDRPDRWGQILSHYTADCIASFKRKPEPEYATQADA